MTDAARLEPFPVRSCAICGKAIVNATGDVIFTVLQNFVHTLCAERLAA